MSRMLEQSSFRGWSVRLSIEAGLSTWSHLGVNRRFRLLSVPASPDRQVRIVKSLHEYLTGEGDFAAAILAPGAIELDKPAVVRTNGAAVRTTATHEHEATGIGSASCYRARDGARAFRSSIAKKKRSFTARTIQYLEIESLPFRQPERQGWQQCATAPEGFEIVKLVNNCCESLGMSRNYLQQ